MNKITKLTAILTAICLVVAVGLGIFSLIDFSQSPDVPAGTNNTEENTDTENPDSTPDTSVDTENGNTGEVPDTTVNTDNGTTVTHDPEKDIKTLEKFADKDELMKYVKETFNSSQYTGYYYVDYDSGVAVVDEAPTVPSDSAVKNESGTSAEADDSGDVSSTNVQVDGIDEGDIIKTDGSYIYILRENELITMDITGEKPAVASYFKIYALNFGYSYEMYIKGDKAIVLVNQTKYNKTPPESGTDDGNDDIDFGTPVEEDESAGSTGSAGVTADAAVSSVAPDIGYSYYYGSKNVNYTVVYILDISDRYAPKELRRIELEGNLLSSRESDGKLYLVNNKNFGWWYAEPAYDDIMPALKDSVYGDSTAEATDTVKCIWENPQPNIMTIAVIDYENNTKADTLTIMGSGTDIYMTAENLYIFGQEYSNSDTYTTIAKFSISDGIGFIGNSKVPGTTSTKFSYDEYNKKFRIATTSSVYNGYEYKTTNNVYVFDDEMNSVGSLTGLAPSEKIYSVRFSGDTAYIVTFRQIDPLFVIDMSKDDPVVLGELKVPGFSTYLHPVGDNLLLGIGSETKDNVYDNWTSTSVIGLKISLFDVSDKANPKEISVANLVGGENAYSEAKDNYKAFVYSEETKTGYFPITVYDSNWNSYQGFVVVKINDENELEVKVITPDDLTYNEYYYYSYVSARVCYAGDSIYYYAYASLSKLDRSTFDVLSTTEIK